MNTNNSISSVIKQLLEINVNSLKTFERINEAVTTDKQTVPLELLTADGVQTVYVPSFGYMKRELERLDKNLKAITDLGDGTSKVKLADGTYQRIYTGSLKAPANDIVSVNRPVEFGIKANYFFEDFLTPLLTTKFDVTNQINPDTERVLIKRLIIDTSFDFAKEFFDTEFKGKDGLLYNDVLSLLASNNIPFYDDEEVRDLPYRSTQYYGTFDITSVDNIQKTVVENGQSVARNIKLYTLDQLTYTDSNKNLKDTETLKPGDELMVNSGNKSTKYRIKTLDTSTRQAELELIQGYEPIKIGTDILRVYKNSDLSTQIEINLGFNESIVVFFKSIDPDSSILSENWSPGAAVYSNELTTTLESGVVKTLADYYKDEVADFGQFIKALKDDAIPPATLGQKPDSPTLIADNFKVVQINKHLTENDSISKVKKLSSDKITVEETLKKLDDTIVKKRSVVSTRKYPSLIERDRDRNELKSLVDARSSETKLYGSLVNQIQSIATDQKVATVSPKFRVRGFWAIPEPKIVAETIPQHVVQFIVQYRYLSTSGKTSAIEQIKFNDGSNERTGVFSNWNEIKTGVRQRVKDETTGKFYWAEGSVEDGQEVNFNQLDLAIQKGEVIEIRIKSVSEAGFPANPIISDWSDVVQISFPEGTLDTTEVTTLVSSNQTEAAYVKISDELESKGVYSHIDDSFIANEKYFSHNATSIASGFLSPEQTPISLFDKLNSLQNEVASLQEALTGIKGELSVKLVSEEGTSININKNTNNKIFAGYYTDEVADLTVKKGHIVTKTFKLLLENTKATQLELISRIIGDRGLPAYRSSLSSSNIPLNGFGIDINAVDSGTTSGVHVKVENDNYYTSFGKYDVVPVQYQNLSEGEDLETYVTEVFNHTAPYQSAQRRGQFIYSRFSNIAQDSNLYVTDPINSNGSIYDYENGISYDTQNAPVPNGNAGAGSDYIWAGSFGIDLDSGQSVPTGTYDLSGAFSNDKIDVFSAATVGSVNYDNGIYLHKDHPDLQNIYTSYSNSAVNSSAMTSTEVISAISGLYDSAIYSNSILANLDGDATNGKKQLGYRNNVLPDSSVRTLKMSFNDTDQYLLGGKSCGAYLYLSPINTDSLLVDGDNRFGKKYIANGENNAVSVDIVFQYRMTDYAGNSSSSDIGRIGGKIGTTLSNLTYSKKIGIDIFDSDSEQFTFDLEIFSKYKAAGANKNSIKAATLSI